MLTKNYQLDIQGLGVRERALIALIAKDDNWHGSDPASADWA